MRKDIGELQHEFLQRLLMTNRKLIDESLMSGKVNPIAMNVKQGIHRMEVLNTYRAGMLITIKG